MRKLATVLGFGVLALLSMTSSVTCGCEPDRRTIAGQLAIFTYPGDDVATVDENIELGRKLLLGRDIKNLTLDQAGLDDECRFVGTTDLHCEFWNETGVVHSKGRFIAIHANSKGEVDSVQVTGLSRWVVAEFGRPNNAFQPTPSARLN